MFKIYEISKKGLDKAKITVSRDSYEQVKRMVKREVSKAKDRKSVV